MPAAQLCVNVPPCPRCALLEWVWCLMVVGAVKCVLPNSTRTAILTSPVTTIRVWNVTTGTMWCWEQVYVEVSWSKSVNICMCVYMSVVTVKCDALKLFLEFRYFYVLWSGVFCTGYTGTNYNWYYIYLHTHGPSHIHMAMKLRICYHCHGNLVFLISW